MQEKNILINEQDFENAWQQFATTWIDEGKDNFHIKYVENTKQLLQTFNKECELFEQVIKENEIYLATIE